MFAVGDTYVIKLFPLDEPAHFETERTALARIDGSLSIPTPRLIEAGQIDEWHFIAMTRMSGETLSRVWPAIPVDERLTLTRCVGTALAELHSISIDACAALAVDWPAFMRDQRATAVARQAAKGLAPEWLHQVDDFLYRWMPSDDGRRVLLHTEVMREHLLAEQRDGAWHLTGLVDFEPAMIGAPEYEFASVGLFVGCAEPGLFAAALDAYGIEIEPERTMAYALLHRYSHLRWYLERLPHDSNASLESLAHRWFGC